LLLEEARIEAVAATSVIVGALVAVFSLELKDEAKINTFFFVITTEYFLN
jgi:hypothetical protein